MDDGQIPIEDGSVPSEDGPPAGDELEVHLETLAPIGEDATTGNEEEEGRAEQQIEGVVRGGDQADDNQ